MKGLTRKTIVTAAALLIVFPTLAAADPAANKVTAARVLLEKVGQGKFDHLEEIYGPGYVNRAFPHDLTLEEDNASTRTVRAAIPELKISIDHIVGEGDLVAVHWRATGANTVAAPPFPGTGRSVVIDGISLFRFQHDRIVEEWSTYDNLATMEQLGMLPAAPPR